MPAEAPAAPSLTAGARLVLAERGVDLDGGTVVVLPSLSFPAAELRKIVGARYYEERLLYWLLGLRRADLRLIYVTSLPVTPEVVDYHLSFLADPQGARQRLTLVEAGVRDDVTLAGALRECAPALARIRAAIGAAPDAYLLPFNVTVDEHAVAAALGVPLFGPSPDQVALGSKSGSRRIARAAGVAVVDGSEDLRMAEIPDALERLARRDPPVQAAVIKLNNGFSGQGNAVVSLRGAAPRTPPQRLPTQFCATEESWDSFAAKVDAEGAVVEELLGAPDTTSPSAQLRINPSGAVEVVSTHDQILGGPQAQVYLGCRFPAHPDYRAAITAAALRVGAVLADRDVIGPFGIDFFVVPGPPPQVYLAEINLRQGGTTHPFAMARLATGGRYDPASGQLRVAGRPKAYIASDNVYATALDPCTPAGLLALLDERGLLFDASKGAGVTLHLLGALRAHAKVGVTCIADAPAAADRLYAQVVRAITDSEDAS